MCFACQWNSWCLSHRPMRGMWCYSFRGSTARFDVLLERQCCSVPRKSRSCIDLSMANASYSSLWPSTYCFGPCSISSDSFAALSTPSSCFAPPHQCLETSSACLGSWSSWLLHELTSSWNGWNSCSQCSCLVGRQDLWLSQFQPCSYWPTKHSEMDVRCS